MHTSSLAYTSSYTNHERPNLSYPVVLGSSSFWFSLSNNPSISCSEGNPNFQMMQTSLTLVGFTQPQATLPIIEDIQNNAKGFTSSILWLFPEPVYCRRQDFMLWTGHEKVFQGFLARIEAICKNLLCLCMENMGSYLSMQEHHRSQRDRWHFNSGDT